MILLIKNERYILIKHNWFTRIANKYLPTSLITALENSFGKAGVSNRGTLWLDSETFSFNTSAIHPETNA